MLSMFCHQENPVITRTENLRKGTRPEIREIFSPHLLQRGPGFHFNPEARSGLKCKIVYFSFWANNLRFLAKLRPIVKSELKL
jgi:hypothetical protein